VGDPQLYPIASRSSVAERTTDSALHAGIPAPPALPAWVDELFLGSATRHQLIRLAHSDRDAALSAREACGLSLVSVQLPFADALSAESFRSVTTELYGKIRQTQVATPAPHAIRIWNFIPGIHAPMGSGLDRYHAFNQGRFDGFMNWFGDASKFAMLLPTATGGGHHGHELTIHALGSVQPGRPIENPRQRPAFRYSRRFGPCPPCFARATAATLPDGLKMLIGGTASVRGEDSMHCGSLKDQLDELISNIHSLLAHARRDSADALDQIDEARVYYRHSDDRAQLEAAIAPRFTAARRIEMVRADICRPELLVEVEALAPLKEE